MTSKRKPLEWVGNDPDSIRLWQKGYREEQKKRAGKRRRKSGPPVKFGPYVQGREDA